MRLNEQVEELNLILSYDLPVLYRCGGRGLDCQTNLRYSLWEAKDALNSKTPFPHPSYSFLIHPELEVQMNGKLSDLIQPSPNIPNAQINSLRLLLK